MIRLLAVIAIIAPITATILSVLYKWGVIEYYQIYKPKIIKSWEVCELCLCFWISSFQVLIICLVSRAEISYIVAPIAAASLAKAIYESSRNSRR